MGPKLLNEPEIYSDYYTQKILQVTNDFKSVAEISEECQIPLMTVYRRVKTLHQFGFLKIRGYIINGVRFTKYKKTNLYLYNKNNLKVRTILKVISENPGIWYSELKRTTGYPHGTLSHHLSKLKSDKKIIAERFGRQTWFFDPQIGPHEINVIIHLRKETTKKILAFLLEARKATFKEIRDKIKKSPSTTSLALTHLIEHGLIRRIPLIAKYELVDEKNTLNALKKIEPSVADTLKDRFADTFSYL
ncbi:MAG: winged helix-turn-helix transcriptional regulator [Nitrosopumilaceae archaeon]